MSIPPINRNQEGLFAKFRSALARTEKSLAMQAVKFDVRAFQALPRDLQGDPDVITTGWAVCSTFLKYLPAEQGNKRTVFAAVHLDGNNLQYAAPHLRADKDVVFAAVNQNRSSLRYADPRWQDNNELHWTVLHGASCPSESPISPYESSRERVRAIFAAAKKRCYDMQVEDAAASWDSLHQQPGARPNQSVQERLAQMLGIVPPATRQ